MKKILFSIITIFALASCRNERTATESTEYDKMYNQLQFERMKDFISRTDSIVSTRGKSSEVITDEVFNDVNIGICKWTKRGRTSKNCQGFGLCNFQWTPLGHIVLKIIANILLNSITDEEYVGIVKEDFFGNTQMIIRLSSIPTMSDIPEFTMDEDVAGEPFSEKYTDEEGNEIKGLPKEIILKKGIYQYDPSIGDCGGYAIDVEVIK